MELSSDLTTWMTFGIVLSTGFLSGLSPCTLPTVIFVAAYVSGRTKYSKLQGFILSLSFVLGIAVMLSILGLFAGMVGTVFLNNSILNYIVAGVLIIMGLWLLKVFDFNFSTDLFQHKLRRGSGFVGAFLLGIPFGISASPCTLPITASVLAYTATKGSMTLGTLLMFTYAIGRSIPLLIVGTFTGVLKHIQSISKYQSIIEQLSGIILIGLAIYFIWIG